MLRTRESVVFNTTLNQAVLYRLLVDVYNLIVWRYCSQKWLRLLFKWESRKGRSQLRKTDCSALKNISTSIHKPSGYNHQKQSEGVRFR